MFNYTAKEYINKILAGVATGIVVGLIPNAIFGDLLKMLYNQTSLEIFFQLWKALYALQFSIPLLIGGLVGLQFGFNGIQTACLAGATFIGSGAVVYTTAESGSFWKVIGTGDLINVMITAFIAVVIIDFLKGRLGSLTAILLPVLGAGIAGLIGLLILPWVSMITTQLGEIINTFTEMQKYAMGILISMSFSFLIISPISTVAIGIAIAMQGVAAGSAALGVAACTVVLVVGSIKAHNKSGVSLAIALGAMKMMIPNLVKHPKILFPVLTTSFVTGIFGALFNISGVPTTAGFGLVGLVGPIGAYNNMTGEPIIRIVLIVLSFIIIPLIVALLSDYVYRRKLHLYDLSIFENNGGM